MADRRLQVFHTVARMLSFTKAADTLHMTQPAVTFQVKQLEEQFNTRLFDRTHNRISLTEAGMVVYEYSERIISLYTEMSNRVGEMTGDLRGHLLIGASTTIAEYMLPRLLGDFKMKYPDVQVRLHVGNTDKIVHMIEDNSIDLGLVEGVVTNKSLATLKCCMDSMIVIAQPDHALGLHESVSAQELLDYPFVSREEGSGTREVTMEYLHQAGIDTDDLHITMELGSPEAVKGAVEGGLGVAIVSEATVLKELALGTLLARPLSPALARPYFFVYQKQKFRSLVMDEFLEFAKERCSKDMLAMPVRREV
ncbi:MULTISPECIES: selenium metabolism-associated LysR family transcriptional regulator [Acidithiobacillus]|uniref:LysR family transcriptional regulator n=2 Tax=Acidithiobacillus TaxID=119977 RepID=A0ABS5ZP95_9PROT|nr:MULTISPECIES: selenium metabolism-associated LysR family transcriptional regulator [Acidithiobacillus]MBU2738486.1 LysR family transcriptional regulator [Acidithiobacillus concretivorus]MDX5934553.1 selenium metabolism-associated LysR family transcriptional regulator [Acidithiobacillus thiooxidans]TQN51333.1 putative RuBisCO transcriptional regulator [Acidithiobacillus thiooxidans ATCC 19377]